MSLAMNFKGVRGIYQLLQCNGSRHGGQYLYSGRASGQDTRLHHCRGQYTRRKTTNSQTDYNIKIGNGSFNASGVATTSTISVEVGSGEVILNNCSAINFKASVDDGDVTLITSDMNKITAELENGDFV